MSNRQLWIIFVPSISILAAVGLASVLFQVRIGNLTNDVAAIANIHPLSGLLSNLGILLWCAAASVCFFTAATLRKRAPRDTVAFLFCSAVVSTYLLMDDLFQFHEDLAIRYLGLNERLVYVAIGVALAAYLISFRKKILRTKSTALLLALGLFAASAAMDTILNPWLWRLGDWEFFFEDGAKWLGIAAWCGYCVQTSHQLLVSDMGLD